VVCLEGRGGVESSRLKVERKAKRKAKRKAMRKAKRKAKRKALTRREQRGRRVRREEKPKRKGEGASEVSDGKSPLFAERREGWGTLKYLG